MQAGLSWDTILKKEEAYNQAFDDFDYHKIALSRMRMQIARHGG